MRSEKSFLRQLSKSIKKEKVKIKNRAKKRKYKSLKEDPELAKATFKGTKTFIPDVYYGKVVKVYDGDTITIATRLGGEGPLFRFSVRLLEIDTPEKRTKNLEEKELAMKA